MQRHDSQEENDARVLQLTYGTRGGAGLALEATTEVSHGYSIDTNAGFRRAPRHIVAKER